MKKQGTWEYVSRARGIQAAVILAIDDGEVILVEQYRVPLGKRCLELPAGLVGDEEEGEAPETSRRASWKRRRGIAPTRSRRSAISNPRPAWSRRASPWCGPPG